MADCSATQPRRVWYLDLLRILASYGIVVLHVSPLGDMFSRGDALSWQTVAAISVLFRWCVPVFLMISGALFLSGERPLSTSQLYRKTISRIAVCYAAWSAFYALVHCALAGKGKWTFLNQLLRGHYHMWYIFAILALYMLTPFLRKITESRKLTEYFLALGFLFAFLLPRLVSFVLLFDIPNRDVVLSLQSALTQANPLAGAHTLYYYVLGHYLHAYSTDRRILFLAVPAAVLGYLATAALTIWHSGVANAVSGRFYDMSSLTVLAFAVGMFLLFKHAFAHYTPGKRAQRALLQLSACAFGVYLVHPFFIERLSLTLPAAPLLLILGIPLLSGLIFLLSFVSIQIIQRVPVVGKFIV